MVLKKKKGKKVVMDAVLRALCISYIEVLKGLLS
jgi:hypothetical protein